MAALLLSTFSCPDLHKHRRKEVTMIDPDNTDDVTTETETPDDSYPANWY